jgi:hypothetical protein
MWEAPDSALVRSSPTQKVVPVRQSWAIDVVDGAIIGVPPTPCSRSLTGVIRNRRVQRQLHLTNNFQVGVHKPDVKYGRLAANWLDARFEIFREARQLRPFSALD